MLLQLLQQLFGSAEPDQLAEEARPGPAHSSAVTHTSAFTR